METAKNISSIPDDLKKVIEDGGNEIVEVQQVADGWYVKERKPIKYIVVQDYDENGGDPISKEYYDTEQEAEKALDELDAPDEWETRSTDHYAFIDTEIKERETIYKFEDDEWQDDGEEFDYIDSERTDHFKDFGARESSARDLEATAYNELRDDVSGEYETNDQKITIRSSGKGKYGDLYIEDSNDNSLGNIELRIADHSYNPANRSGIEDAFISVVIANKDETAGKFHGRYNLYFSGEDDYDDIVERVKERIQEILDDLDIEQRFKDANKNLKDGGTIQKPQTMNPFIGDNFFKENPSKVLGTQTMKKGRFGEVIHVEGSMSNIEKIEAAPVAVADLYPASVQTTATEQEVIEKVFETEEKETTAKKVSKRRQQGNKATSSNASRLTSDDDVYSFTEIDTLYNKGISRDEKEAYYLTHPELNYKLLFDKFTNSRDDLFSKKLICWDPEEKKFVYYITYRSGNIGKKISDLQKHKEKFVEQFGQVQYDIQMDMLIAAKPKSKGLTGDEKITILPHSNFAKGFNIIELRFGKPELHSETSLFSAFRRWLYQLPADQFNKTTSREVIDFYLDNKSIPIDDRDKEAKLKSEKNAINIRQRTKEEGDQLFSRFLSDELTPDDQAKLQYLWNEKFNSYAEPDLTKIPVCFQISKKFKKGPLFLNPTQRQAAAFQQEKFSALLAYGVGVGKTLASIVCYSQAYYNGYSKKGCFVVPTNTYDKWLGEIQGYTDKESGEFMHGAMPQLPPVVGLFNLNPTIVKDTLKDYSKKDEAVFDSIMNAITKLKKFDVAELKQVHRNAIDSIYKVNWLGLESQYSVYLAESKAANKKVFADYVIDYLRDEYNYYIYALGTIKKFPDGTIFVTTEVGLQRLGISDINKQDLASRLYFILSQGEKTAGTDSNRDIAKLQEKINQTVSSSQKNAKLFVEDLGIDWVCFDEAHYYKKIFTFVKGDITGEKTKYNTDTYKSEVVGVKRDKSKYEIKSGQYPSSRALSAFVLSHFIQSKNNNRNVIQLTATPFTNSPLEVYSMLALTNFKALEDLGVGKMVDFFDTFMKINYDIKYTPQKTVVKDVVLTGYNNLPQLRQIIYSLMDKKDEGASLKRPVKHIWPSIEKNIETTLPMTQEQQELMKEVKRYINGDNDYEAICASALADEVENTDYDGLDDEALITEWERVTQKEYEGEREKLTDAKRDSLIRQIKDNKLGGVEFTTDSLDEEESAGVRILKALAMMRQITLSPYLYYKACNKASGATQTLPGAEDYVNSSPKFKYTMGCIASAMQWHAKTKTKPGGHVIYMNAGVEYFPLLKEYLVKKIGLKQSQVGIVSGSMSKSAKEAVKQGFLRGDILVLIGSSTISVGVDLQTNATTLYNLYYDWNPTDAQQIEGRIWRQGNRFANVRIMYPQCYNSADPVIFEYLNSKTLRINEIWNRSSEVQELDLRDFNPKELQKKLITDPEEKADWEILEESDKIEGEIIFAENRKETLSDAMYSYRNVNDLRPQVKTYLSDISSRKLQHAKAEAVTSQKEKINDIVEKYTSDPQKMADEIDKYRKSRYDHEKDPENKYAVPDYSTAPDEKLYTDAKKYIDQISDWTYKDTQYGDLYYNRSSIESTLKEFRNNYRDMKAAEERVLKPMGLSFETASDPIVDFNKKIDSLHEQLTQITATRDQRIQRFKDEAIANRSEIKTVADRVNEFAAANDAMLGPQLLLTDNKEEVRSEKSQVGSQKPDIPKPVNKLPEKEINIPKVEIPTEKPLQGKALIEKQINALAQAAKFAKDKGPIEKQIKGLEFALKYAA